MIVILGTLSVLLWAATGALLLWGRRDNDDFGPILLAVPTGLVAAVCSLAWLLVVLLR